MTLTATLLQNLTLALISDATVMTLNSIHPAVAQCMFPLPPRGTRLMHSHQFFTDVHLTQERDSTGRQFYQPIVFPNEFWHLRSQYIELNSTTPRLPLEIVFQPMSYWKFTMFAAMTSSFAEAAKQQGGASHAEFDEIKRMLVETNPWFLGLTALVSVLHMVYVQQSTARNLADVLYAGSRCWRSPPTSRIGGIRRNSSVYPSGM